MPSLQFTAPPPTHDPPAQASFWVQAFPSLHGLELGEKTHPDVGEQVSVVQALESLQTTDGPGTQTPPEQTSVVVQASRSLQGRVLLVFTQPVAGLQVSSVQTLKSLQLSVVPPWQVPLTQMSAVVQAFPSLHAELLLACVHPVAGLHASVVQIFPSLQFGAGPPTHVPPAQVSPVVHALPSLQVDVLFE